MDDRDPLPPPIGMLPSRRLWSVFTMGMLIGAGIGLLVGVLISSILPVPWWARFFILIPTTLGGLTLMTPIHGVSPADRLAAFAALIIQRHTRTDHLGPSPAFPSLSVHSDTIHHVLQTVVRSARPERTADTTPTAGAKQPS